MSLMSAIPFIVTGLWLMFTVGLGLAGKARLINDEPLPPLIGAVVAPLIVLFIGAAFAVIGVIMTAPIWIWFVFK